MKKKYVIYIFISSGILASSGSLDTTFGTNGIATTSIGRLDLITSCTLQTDSKIMVAGITQTKGAFTLSTARYTSNGILDTTYNSIGTETTLIGTMSEGNSIAIQADGKIVVGGLSYTNNITQLTIVRYNTNGSLDTTFNGTGFVTTTVCSGAQINSLKIQGDGNIIVGGTSICGQAEFILARYTATGSLDATFGSSGITLTPLGMSAAIRQIVLQPDGKIVVAGYINNGSTFVFAVARYTTTGSLDATFGSGGIVTTIINAEAQANAVTLDASGNIIVAGYTINSGITEFAVARYTSSGILDATFNATGIVTTQLQNRDVAYAVAIQTNGQIVVAGSSDGNCSTQFALVRYNTNGSLDTTFGTNGIVLTNVSGDCSIACVNALAIQTDSKIIAAGYTSDDNSKYADFALARYLP